MEVLQVIDPKWIINQVVQECSHLNEQVKKHKAELKSQGNILDMRLSTITSVLRDKIEICNDPKYPENYLETTGNRSSWRVKPESNLLILCKVSYSSIGRIGNPYVIDITAAESAPFSQK